MTVIRTSVNRVVADEPEKEDLFVRVTWHGPDDDGRHLRAFDGPLLPIEDYQAAVDWAVGMADQMRFPLYVVPMTGRDALRTEGVRRAVASLTDHERGELRRLLVAKLAGVLRDCDDQDVRADAYDLLLDMKVIRP